MEFPHGGAGAHHRQNLIALKEAQKERTFLLSLCRRVRPAAQGEPEVGILLLPGLDEIESFPLIAGSRFQKQVG